MRQYLTARLTIIFRQRLMYKALESNARDCTDVFYNETDGTQQNAEELAARGSRRQ
jgi:hypothetical protein